MSKIRLSIEDLSVESFATCAAEGGHGTVFGRAELVAVTAEVTRCTPECETYYGYGACSANDGCASAPHAWTPCAGCVGTEFCVMSEICMEVGELG